MKKTRHTWMGQIPTVQKGKNSHAWFTASCPVCGHQESMTVLGSEIFAETNARAKVLKHILIQHEEMVEQQPHL